MTVSNYTYITDPPVKQVESKEEFRRLINELRAILRSGGAEETDSAFRVLKSMESCLDEEESETDKYFAYMVTGQPNALLITSGGMSKKIDELVGVRGTGWMMCEVAMNVCNGVASLDSFDTASTGFWSAMGFEKYAELPAQQEQGGCKMRLNCSKNDKWQKLGGKWRITKYVREIVLYIPPPFTS